MPDTVAVLLSARDLLCGIENPHDIAQQWIAAGFDADGIAEWGVGTQCFYPADAATLRDAGVEPEQVATRLDSGMTIGYAYANGDIDLAGVLDAAGTWWDAEQVARHLGIGRDSVRRTMARMGVPAMTAQREPGRPGNPGNVYRAAGVVRNTATRPGPGTRTDLRSENE